MRDFGGPGRGRAAAAFPGRPGGNPNDFMPIKNVDNRARRRRQRRAARLDARRGRGLNAPASIHRRHDATECENQNSEHACFQPGESR
jgi:hypothetical protein